MSWLAPPAKSTPTDDQLEISVFGLGVGESIVLHVGKGEWVLVDSFINPKTGNPIAVDYLSDIGIDFADHVKGLVLSHWHNDHTRGAKEILTFCRSVMPTAAVALNDREFFKFVVASEIEPEVGTDAFKGVLEVLRERRQSGRIEEAGFRWAKANTLIFNNGVTKITALSPSDATISLAFHEIGQLLQPKTPKRRAVAQQPNELAVVLWVEFGDISILLGADLENGSSSATGWKGIVGSALRPPGKAIAFKIPHHGSVNGHEPTVWTEMLEKDPLCLLTPYNAGKAAIPTEVDVLRLKALSNRVYISHPPKGSKPTGLSKTVEKVMRRIAPDIRDLTGDVGQVRIRFSKNSSDPLVEMFGRAERL